MAVRDQIFISYSHDDREWLDRFHTKLKPIEHRSGIKTCWSDKDIETGAEWNDEIENAIARARIALLLVSDKFLESDFIDKEELPRIIKAHQEGALRIFWVPIKEALVEESLLVSIQAATNPKRPLAAIEEENDLDAVITGVCRDISAALGQHSAMDEKSRSNVRDQIAESFGERLAIEDEIGSGDYTIVYRGRLGTQTVAIKALTGTAGQPWTTASLDRRVDQARRLRDPTFIQVYDASLEQDPRCVVMEYVEGRRLDGHLRRQGPMAPSKVQGILGQIARALTEYHQKTSDVADQTHLGATAGLAYGVLRSADVLYDDEEGSVRISAIDLSNEIVRSARLRSKHFISHELLSYLTPEQYRGWPITPLTDQYWLGLLALELLRGRLPIRVRWPVDLERLHSFFKDPRAWFEGDPDGGGYGAVSWRRAHPSLAWIVARMLRYNPRRRWPSMADALRALEASDIDPASIEELARHAKESYQRHCCQQPEFYRFFYAELFRLTPEVEGYFAGMDMERQHHLLDEAIERLLNFRPGPEPTTLSRTREQHERLDLTTTWFDRFGEALVNTLRAHGEEDDDVLDAWEATLRPGLDYMKRYCAAEPVVDPARQTARPSAAPDGRAAPPATPAPPAAAPTVAAAPPNQLRH